MRRIPMTILLVLSITPGAWNLFPSAEGDQGRNANWPQWRGPESQGVSQERNLPVEWSATKNVLWKTPIPGQGFSQPVIWGNRIFLTTDIESGPAPVDHKAVVHMMGEKEFKHPDWVGADKLHTFEVLCLDRDTGKLLWERTAHEGTVFDHRSRRGTYAGPTPATDGKYVYAYFGSEGVYCYDFEGNLTWKKSLGGIGTMGMGVGTSPVLYGRLVILICDQEFDGKHSFIVALDKETGREVWREKRQVGVSWATPVVVETEGRAELVTSGNEFIISYDPETGREWWRAEGLKSHAIATPAVKGDLVIVSSGFPSKIVKAIRLGGSGVLDGTDKIVWTYSRGTAYVPSPIIYGDYLYLMSDGGILTCLEAKTGKLVYEGGRVPVATQFYGASPVAFDDKILLTCDDGDTFVIRAGPTHDVIGTNSIDEPSRVSIAISDGRLFIRGERHLFCIGSSSGKDR
ncbi:MAG: PQQ-binding-like beta-propeller repeat protein [Acidobacteriota bacterium]